MKARPMVQETLAGVDVREREPLRVELPTVDLTKYTPGQAVRTKKVLIACPTCGKTGEPQLRRYLKDEDRLAWPVAHVFVPTEAGNYVVRAVCNADPFAVKQAVRAANAIVAGG